jgi:hypothetical protein
MKKTRSHPKRADLLPREVGELSDRQRDVLESLAALSWAQPMDVGGRDGSHHSATLSGLAKRGLVERKKLHAIYCYNGLTHRQQLVEGRWVVTDGHPPSTKCCCKGSCRYKITPAGREAIKDVNR